MTHYDIPAVITGSEEITGDRSARQMRRFNDDLSWASKVKVKPETLMDRSSVLMTQDALERTQAYHAEAIKTFRDTSPRVMQLKRMAASRVAFLEAKLEEARAKKVGPRTIGKIQERRDALLAAMGADLDAD